MEDFNIPEQRLADNSTIKFGKYKGEKLANVPDKWLIWYYEQHKFDKNNALVKYIYDSGLIKL